MPARILFLLVLAGAATAQDREATAVRLDPTATPTAYPRITFPKAEFDLAAGPGEGIAVPEPDLARHATVELGGKTIALTFAAPGAGTALGLLWSDAAKGVRGRARKRGARFVVEFGDVPAAGGRYNVLLYWDGDRQRGVIEPAHHRRGRAVVGGDVREVILIDADGDGTYDGPRDRWVALRPQRAARVKTLKRAEGMLLNEPQVPFEEDGRALMVEDVAADGSSLRLVLGTPSMPMARVLDRRYAEVRRAHFAAFEKELEEFAREHELDLARPRAPAPPEWPLRSLSDAQSLALKQRKPLLVFYFSEANPWSYRYDFYTFADKEVADELKKFVLARIDIEKDPEHSYEKSGARGLPVLQPFTFDGRAVTFTMRHRLGPGEVKDLAHPETMITGWQRPQELVVNLRRIRAKARD